MKNQSTPESNKGAKTFGKEFLPGSPLITESIFKIISDSSPNGIFITDPNGNCIYINSAYNKISGLSNEEAKGQGWISAIHPEDREAVKNSWYDFAKSKTDFHSVHRFIKQNRQIAWTKVIAKEIIHEGLFIGFLGIVEDITKQKLYEEKLRYNENLLKNVFNGSADALLISGIEDQKIFSCNQRALVLFEVSNEDEILNDYFSSFIKFPNWNEQSSLIQQCCNNETLYVNEAVFFTKRGNEFHGKYYLKKISSNDQDLLLIQISDITERVQTENQLKLSEKRYKDLFNYSLAHIFTHDLKGRILRLNPSACKALHYNREEFVGKSLFDLIPSSSHPELKKYLVSFQTESSNAGVLPFVNKDGTLMYWMYQNYKVEEDGIPPFIIGFAQDITERVAMEQEMVVAKVTAEESVKAKELFIARMSHEMRTPLNGIIGVTDLLEKTKVNPMQNSYLEIIKNSAKNLLVIINDLLDFSKIISGKLELEEVNFNLSQVINNVINGLLYKANEKGLILKSDIKFPASSILKGDPFKLQQILLNLINNAVKFTHSGYVSVEVSILSETEEEVTLRFLVADTGIGIPEDKKEKIFEEFTQVSGDQYKYGGTGLGLSICKDLVNLLKGKIWVESKEKEGSSFFFSLTYGKSEGPVKLEEPFGKLDYQKIKFKKILVVESNEVNALLLQSWLEEWNCFVEITNNDEEVLRLIEKESFDLMLMDVEIPELNVRKIVKVIREISSSGKSELPIVAIAAIERDEEKENIFKSGMNDILIRPFEQSDLLKIIIKNINNQSMINDFDNMGSENGDPLYDLSMLSKMGDQKLVDNIIRVFVKTVPPQCEEMKRNLNQKDWTNLKETAHKLKPNVDMLGVSSLYEVIRNIEFHPNPESNEEELTQHVYKVINILSKVVEELSKM